MSEEEQTTPPEVQPEVIESDRPKPKVRQKTFMDALIDRAAQGSSDLIKNNIIPGIQVMLADTFHNAVDMIFVTRNTGRRPGSSATNLQRPVANRQTRVSYSEQSNQNAISRRSISDRARAQHDFSEIIFESRPEANGVLDDMRTHLEKYQSITIDQMYSFIGIDPTFRDSAWGWTNLDGSFVKHVRNGFVLELPAPEPLN